MIEDLHNKLNGNGFVIIDLLEQIDIAYLNQLCDKYLKANQADFVSSSHILNKNDSDFINAELHRIIHEKFTILFPDLQLLGGTLATKTKGISNLKAHQDWTIVDESKYNSYNLWIPLVDTNQENGTLGLITGSHLWNHNLRGFGIPNEFEKFTDQFLKIGYEPELKAGQAILYNHRLIHYSRPNKTNKNRNTAIVGVKDKAADLQISFSINGKDIDTYTMTESEFYQFDTNRIIATQTKLHSNSFNKTEIKWNDIYSAFTKYASQEIFNDINVKNDHLSIWNKIINRFFYQKKT